MLANSSSDMLTTMIIFSPLVYLQGLHLLEKDTGRNILLTTEAPISKEGSKLTPIRYANDLDIAADGTIFFSDSCDVAPAMNAAGFYDTMATYILNLAQVIMVPEPSKLQSYIVALAQVNMAPEKMYSYIYPEYNSYGLLKNCTAIF